MCTDNSKVAALGRFVRGTGRAIQAAKGPPPVDPAPATSTDIEGLENITGPVVVPQAVKPPEPRGTALFRFLLPAIRGAAAGAVNQPPPTAAVPSGGFGQGLANFLGGFGAAEQQRQQQGLFRAALTERQRRAEMVEAAEARQQVRFEQEQADAPLRRAGFLQGLSLGQANLDRLALANQLAGRKLAAGDATDFENTEQEIVSSLGNLSGEEQSLLRAARAKARQTATLDPFFDFSSRVLTQRGTSERSQAGRDAAFQRLAITQGNILNRLLLQQGAPPQGFLDARQEGGIEQAAQQAATRIARGEAKLSNFGRGLHPAILDNLGDSLIASPKQRDAFASLAQAERLVDLIERETNRVINSSGEDRVKASVVLTDLTNSLGAIFARGVFAERGVLTDADVKRSTGLVPRWKAANFVPGIARTEINILREILIGAKTKVLDEFRTFTPLQEGQQKRRFRIDGSGNVIEVRE